MKLDRHLTPENIANYIIDDIMQSKELEWKLVADFSCASGKLMKRITDYVKVKKIVLNDVEKNIVDCSLFENSDLEVYNLDFESEKSVRELRKKNGYDLIVINPPYSNRGNKRYTTSFGDIIIKSSRVVKHILNSLSLVSNKGVIYCVVPTNIFLSETDRRLMTALQISSSLNKIREFARGHFTSASVETVLIRIKDYDEAAFIKAFIAADPSKYENELPLDFIVGRGNVAMHTLNDLTYQLRSNDRVRYIHTTNINSKKPLYIQKNKKHRTFSGRYIIIPRVGTPSVDKIIIVNEDEFVVSDCILVIYGNKIDDLLKILHKNYETVESMFSGHCAKYTTLSRINNLVAQYEKII